MIVIFSLKTTHHLHLNLKLAVTFLIGALWPLHHLTYGDDSTVSPPSWHRFGKIAAVIVGLLLMLVTLNKLRLTPGLLAGDRSVVAKIKISIKAEMTVASLILLITAVFTPIIGPSV